MDLEGGMAGGSETRVLLGICRSTTQTTQSESNLTSLVNTHTKIARPKNMAGHTPGRGLPPGGLDDDKWGFSGYYQVSDDGMIPKSVYAGVHLMESHTRLVRYHMEVCA